MSKAFDKIDHSIISSVLSFLGFGDKLKRFFESYLRGTKMSVAYNDFNSKIYVQNSGVTQGSILGPFLFTLYRNHIAQSSASGILLYVDDIKIFNFMQGRLFWSDLQITRNCESLQQIKTEN